MQSNAPTGIRIEPREALLQRARALIASGRIPQALPVLQELTDFDAADVEAWCLVAEAWNRWGYGDRGLRAAELALKADPRSLTGQLWKIRSMLLLDQKKATLDTAREALETFDRHPEIRRIFVQLLIANERIPEAEASLTPLLTEFPADPDLVVRSGEIHFAKRDFPAAEAAFASVLTTASDPADAWAWLGATRMRQERVREAVPCYYQAAVAAPAFTAYRKNLVELIDSLYQRKVDYFKIFYLIAALVAIVIAGATHVLALIPAIAAAVWGWKVSRASLVNSVLRPYAPEVGDYFRAQKPVVDRELAPSLRFVWFLLILILVLVFGAGEFSRRGAWPDVGRLLLIVLPPAFWFFVRAIHRQKYVPGGESAYFWFPEDPAESVHSPEFGASSDPVANTRMLLHSQRLAAARRTAARALAVEPGRPEVHHVYSLALLASGETAAALAAAERARGLAPQDPASQALVWLVRAVGGSTEEVLEETRRLPDLAEAAVEPFAGFVRDLSTAGALTDARVATELMTRWTPESPAALGLKASEAFAAGRLEEAEASYRKALDLDPVSPDLLTGLGWLEWKRLRCLQARDHWLRALQAGPNHTPAADALAHMTFWTLSLASFGVTLGAVLLGLYPTLAGQLRNDWMTRATLVAPILAAASVPALRPAIVLLLLPKADPALKARATEGTGGVAWISGIGALALALIVQSLQAWAEIALHPSLMEARWKGAATVTVIATYTLAAILAVTSGWRKEQKELEEHVQTTE